MLPLGHNGRTNTLKAKAALLSTDQFVWPAGKTIFDQLSGQLSGQLVRPVLAFPHVLSHFTMLPHWQGQSSANRFATGTIYPITHAKAVQCANVLAGKKTLRLCVFSP